ncbi:hypothetical protein [Pedobacter miscanthi]|uniref:hypothetical protein n=1 Tax=Pedobacter miscanthi TaxID=2259170 RepID=UPI0011BDC487|nr:hypothetical protein [Pedobacter miscanthi]
MKTTTNNNLIIKCLASAFAMLIFNACSREKQPELAPTALYQEMGMHPVTSSFNTKKQVISVLYANDVVRKNLHTGAGKYTLVRWEQKPHPLWFGGNTNGKILSVEKITSQKMPTASQTFITKNNQLQMEKRLKKWMSGSGSGIFCHKIFRSSLINYRFSSQFKNAVVFSFPINNFSGEGITSFTNNLRSK